MMLNPKYQKYADRLKELTGEGYEVAKLERPSPYGGSERYIQDPVPLEAWKAKVRTILLLVFGPDSAYSKEYTDMERNHIEDARTVKAVVGLLLGALDDLKNGFLVGQEFIVAGEVYDSILEQAKGLLTVGQKDPAAMLGRVVLEDALRRLARQNGLDDTAKAATINDELKKAGVYAQPQWRLNQACLDVGNSAAHGQFGDYTAADVASRLEDTERFLASYLT